MTSVLIHRVARDAIPILSPKDWRDDALRRHSDGARVLSVFGERSREDIKVTSIYRDAAGAIELVGMRTTAQLGHHELTSSWPALHCFEREIHEQTGARIAGHPWLKPVRYEGQTQAAMGTYPFYKVEGKEVHEVAVGPVHAGVIEPGSFRFMCHGEQVHHLEIHLGYQHRGVERKLLEGDPRRLAPLVETIAGDTSIAHTWAYCAALEGLAGVSLGIETELARAIMLELERIAMHLASLSGLAADIGFLQGASTYGRLRTTTINTTMRLCGSRFGRGALRPGGVALRPSRELLPEVSANLELLKSGLAIINDRFSSAQTVRHRLQGVGRLTTHDASALGLVGLVARASGVPVDVRAGTLEGAYHAIPITPRILEAGDCWARAQVRVAELDDSLRWLERALELGEGWDAPSNVALAPPEPLQMVVTVVEGWRGEVVHCLETDAAGGLAHYKVQDPSLRNWMGLAMAVRDNEISDFPVCNKSFDLSYCGNDL